MFVGIDIPLLAVPFFILAAELMSGGSLTGTAALRKPVVGHLRGGLGHANVLSLTMFSGIAARLADAAGPGAMLVR
jgi:TRAP-type C4-dicarboxylate transport system permease large subunit